MATRDRFTCRGHGGARVFRDDTGRVRFRDIVRNERLALRPTFGERFDGATDKRSGNEWIDAAVRLHQYTLTGVADRLSLRYQTVGVLAKRPDEECKP